MQEKFDEHQSRGKVVRYRERRLSFIKFSGNAEDENKNPISDGLSNPEVVKFAEVRNKNSRSRRIYLL